MELEASNNAIIQGMTPEFLDKLHERMKSYDIKHRRTGAPLKPKAKFKKQGGEITTIGINLTKGLIMTHKGKGRGQENGNRKEKPFFNEPADEFCNDLADAIAVNSGDVVCGNLAIR